MNHQTPTEDLLTPPPVYLEDVQQEMALARLQGKKPSRRLITKRQSTYEAVLFSEVPPSAEPVLWSEPETSLETYQQLILWAQTQSSAISNLLYNFLEQPTEKGLEKLLTTLTDQGIITQQEAKKSTRGSLTEAIRAILSTRPHTIEELYQYARTEQPSKRPEASIRQILRRLVRSGEITFNAEENTYHAD